MAARTATAEWLHAVRVLRVFWIGVLAFLIATVQLTALVSSAAVVSALQGNSDAPSKHQPNEDGPDELTSLTHGSCRGMRCSARSHVIRYSPCTLQDARMAQRWLRSFGFIMTSSEHAYRNGIGTDLVC